MTAFGELPAGSFLLEGRELYPYSMTGTSSDPSGAAAAQAAHDAGAVVVPIVHPMVDVTIEFRCHGPADQVRELADAVGDVLSGHPLVVPPVTTATVTR